MAADLTESFMGKHFEKIVLAAAVVIFAAAMIFFVVDRQHQDSLRKQVETLLDSTKVKATEVDLNTIKALTPDERMSLGLGQPPRTVESFKADMMALGQPWQAATKMEVVVAPPPPPIDKVAAPTPPVVQPVDNVNVVVGRGVTTEAFPTPLSKIDAKNISYSDINWATCVGQVNLSAQLRAYDTAHVAWQQIIINRVDIQRRELKPDGTWTEWKPVAPYVPAAIRTKMAKTPTATDHKAVQDWAASVYKQQVETRRMPLPVLVASDAEGKVVQQVVGNITTIEQPSLIRPVVAPPAGEPGATPTGTAPVAAGAPTPAAVGAGGLPPWMRDVPTPGAKGAPSATAAGGAASGAAAQDVYATVWANDLTVEPGKTYQYQMRVSILSPIYLGERVSEKDRWAIEFTSAWSQPSAEAAVPPLVEFYFIGSNAGRANLELHRWIMGQWVIIPSAATPLGGPVVYTKARTKLKVPGQRDEVTKDIEFVPNVLLVDVVRDFPYKPAALTNRVTTRLLIFADAQGKLGQRVEWEDRVSAAKLQADRKDVIPAMPVLTSTSTTAMPPPPVRPPAAKPKTPPRP